MCIALWTHESNDLGDSLHDFGKWPMRAWEHWLRCQYLDEKWYNGPTGFWLLPRGCEGGVRGKVTGNLRQSISLCPLPSLLCSLIKTPCPTLPSSSSSILHAHVHTCMHSCLNGPLLATHKEIQTGLRASSLVAAGIGGIGQEDKSHSLTKQFVAQLEEV